VKKRENTNHTQGSEAGATNSKKGVSNPRGVLDFEAVSPNASVLGRGPEEKEREDAHDHRKRGNISCSDRKSKTGREDQRRGEQVKRDKNSEQIGDSVKNA